MASSDALLASLGVAPSAPAAKDGVRTTTDLFGATIVLDDPLGAAAPKPSQPAPLLPRGSSDVVHDDREHASHPLGSVPFAPSNIAPLPPLRPPPEPIPYEDVPALTALYPGETLVDRPIPAKRARTAGGAHMQPDNGMLYVTSVRVVWEPEPRPASAKGRPTEPGPSSIDLPLHAIDRLKKLRSGSGGKGGEGSGGVDDPSHLFSEGSERGTTGSSRRGGGITSRRGGGVVEVEIFVKWGAWPATRLALDEASFTRLQTSLNDATLNTPSKSVDLRADLRRCFAVACWSLAHATQQPAVSWTLYDAETEFHRQGLLNPLSHWRICRLNEKYELCPTYPRLLVVPNSVSDEDILSAAKFRSSRRLPVLCWKDPMGIATICRSSQPCVGVQKSRSSHDEQLLTAIADTNPFGGKLQIIDCRPRVNAELNQVATAHCAVIVL